MAKSTETQWIPSGGVLAVAIGAALVAAILVNVYVGYARSAYENGSTRYLQITKAVNKGDPIQDSSLDSVPVPKILALSFKLAIADAPQNRTLIHNSKAPRTLSAGEFLWYPEFTEIQQGPTFNIPVGSEEVTIMLNPQPLGQQLQPGGYVAVHGEYNYGIATKPEWQSVTVMKKIQVKALGGSTEPVAAKARTYDNIQIVLTSAQAEELMKIIEITKGGKFTLGVVAPPEANATEQGLSEEIETFMKNRARPAATGTAPGKSVGPATLPPDDL